MAPTRKIAPVVEDDTTSKMSDDTFDTSQRPKFSDITKVIVCLYPLYRWSNPLTM